MVGVTICDGFNIFFFEIHNKTKVNVWWAPNAPELFWYAPRALKMVNKWNSHRQQFEDKLNSKIGLDFDCCFWSFCCLYLKPKWSKVGKEIGSGYDIACKVPNLLNCVKHTVDFCWFQWFGWLIAWIESWQTAINKNNVETRLAGVIDFLLIVNGFLINLRPILGEQIDQEPINKC